MLRESSITPASAEGRLENPPEGPAGPPVESCVTHAVSRERARVVSNAPSRRISLFLQEPFAAPRTSALRVGVICDGTTRGGPNGIAEGAARVVACAERCAERADVDLFAAFILSPQNLVRRAAPFFAGLHAEFLRLLEAVLSGRALVGIRVEVLGRLDGLRARGPAGARLADTVELLVEATSSVAAPRARLALGIDYPEDAPVAWGLDVLVRTGMEEPRVLRLSGLRVRKETMCIPIATLWRRFTPADLDAALAVAVEHARPEPAAGFPRDLVLRLAAEIATVDLPSPVRLLVPVAGPPAEMLARTPAPEVPRGVVLTVAAGPGARPLHLGPRGARVEIRLFDHGGGAWPRGAEPVAWLVPGQAPPVLRLLERSARDANIHVCEPTPRGLAEGVREALRFHAAHPPLHGAPRARATGGPPAEDRVASLMRFVAERPARSARDLAIELGGDAPLAARTGDVFAAGCLVELRSSGLVSGEVDWGRQAFGYALTAFAIARGGPETEEAWEPPARDLARAMLVMASSDEEISDRVFEGETPAARRARLVTSVDHLCAILGGASPGTPPVLGAEVLAAIARAWRDFFDARARDAHPSILAGARRAAEMLYRANLEELSRADPFHASLVRRLRRGSRVDRSAPPPDREPLELTFSAASPPLSIASPPLSIASLSLPIASPPLSIASPPLSMAVPEPLARRFRELSRAVREGPRDVAIEALRELRLLCRLRRVAPSIGAGCAFLVMACTEPASAVPAAGAAALLRVTPLIDHAFRLANDLAFTDATRGDRDDKPNAFTCLVPPGLRGKARERASAEALRTCRAVLAWLEAEIREATSDLARAWPLAAGWLVRGMHVGRRAYQNGHYDRLTSSAIGEIVLEVSGPPPEGG